MTRTDRLALLWMVRCVEWMWRVRRMLGHE